MKDDQGREALYQRTPLTFTLGDFEYADSGAGDGSFTLRGHAAVFDRLSHDLGGFKTRIRPGAFDEVLNNNPTVHLVWDHDTRYTLASTKSKTLELRVDPIGLHTWARIAPVSYAQDLRVLMERGDISEMSFSCDIGQDEWTIDANDNVTRDIISISALYDVTVCAQGAFPQTDASLVASLAKGGATPPDAAAVPEEGPDGEAVAPEQDPVGRRLAAARADAHLRLLKTTQE